MNIKNTLLTILSVILLAACGGGGGGGGSATPNPTPTPAPTPAPETYSFEGNFYTTKSISSFNACIDLNFNMTCDSSDLQTSNYESNSQTNYNFTITTQNESVKNQINENVYFLVIELNKNTDDYLKLYHPGFRYSDLIGVSVNTNPFSTAFSDNYDWVQFPGFLYLDNSNEPFYAHHQEQVVDILDREIYRIRNTDGLEVNEFFSELSNNSCCLNEERANLFESYASHGSKLERRLVDDLLDIAQTEGANFFGVPTAGKTPTINTNVRPFKSSLRIFNSSTFPNDTTGIYVNLDKGDRFTLPFSAYINISYENFVNGWTGSFAMETYPGITEYLGDAYFSKREAECDINPGFTCRSTFSLQNLLTSTPYQREIFRVSSRTSNGNYDSFVDNYRLRNTGGEPDCANWEAAERSSISINYIEYKRIENAIDSFWDGQNCASGGNSGWVYQYAFKTYLDTKSQLSVSFGSENCCFDGYFVNMPYDIYQEAENIFNSSNSITGELDNYLNDISADLSILGDLVNRISNQNLFYYHFVRLVFYPYPWSNTRNELMIDTATGELGIYCDVNGERLLGYLGPTSQQIDEVIDLCVPYLTNGFNFGSEPIESYSPYIGGDTTTINNFSSYKFSHEYRIDYLRKH